MITSINDLRNEVLVLKQVVGELRAEIERMKKYPVTISL